MIRLEEIQENINWEANALKFKEFYEQVEVRMVARDMRKVGMP